MVTAHLSSSLGEEAGNPDSDAEKWKSQLTSLAGWFWCQLSKRQLNLFYLVSLSWGTVFVPAFGWQLLTVSTQMCVQMSFCIEAGFPTFAAVTCQGPEHV